MKIEKIKHAGVNTDGTFKTGAGSVEVNGRIYMSAENGGCGIPNCKCMPGHWIMISLPRKGSVVEEIKVDFDNKNELDQFLKLRQLILPAKKK